MKIHTAKDMMSKHSRNLKLLITGTSGVGKTTWAAKAKRPLFAITEAQGIPSVTSSNPDAAITHITDVAAYSTLMQAFANAVKNNKLGSDEHGVFIEIQGRKISTLVTDSLGDLQGLLIDDYLDPANGKVSLTMQEWGWVISKTEGMLKWQRSLPINTVMTCLTQWGEDENGNRIYEPAVSGKRLPSKVGQYFSGVGYAYKTDDRYEIMWDGSSVYPNKPAPTLRPDGKRWPKRTHDLSPADLLAWSFPSGKGDATVEARVAAVLALYK